MEQIMRLQKFIAKAGFASRRKAETVITDSRVKVNGITVTELGTKVDASVDVVSIDGKVIVLEEEKVYIMLHKPEGYITTMDDQFDRETVADLVKDIPYRVYPIGRLDFNTSGLLLMTNDGDFANHIMHPSNHVKKTYLVIVKGALGETQIDRFKTGVVIDGYKTAPAELTVLKTNNDGTTSLRVVIAEGKNRQIRKMFEVLDTSVIKLKRIAVGNVLLRELEQGRHRKLNDKELGLLRWHND